MNVIKRIQANRLARRLQAADAAPESLAMAREQLLELGPEAIRAILESLGGEKARGPTLDLLQKLLTNDSLPAFIDALKSEQIVVVEAAMYVLSNARSYDATQLLPLFSDPDVSRARLESILAEQVDSLQPRMLLELMPALSRDARASVFRLLEKRSDESIAAGATRLAEHTDWWMRQSMAKLLAKHPGEESVQVLVKLLGDEVSAVRL